MVRLYCVTNGFSNDLLHAVIRRCRPPLGLAGDGVLGRVDADLVDRLRADGYVVFQRRLDPDLCDRLTGLATRTPGEYRPPLPNGERFGPYEPRRPGLQTCWLDEASLAADPDIQALVADPSLLGLAESYLRSRPTLSILAMWWSQAGSSSDDDLAEKAQMFHFDLDRVKWLKFFVYLTDVAPENGPHVFVRRSHRRGHKPRSLLRRGYRRIADRELTPHVSTEDIIEITGPKGTMFVADTSGFHKGKPPAAGERLVLQLEFSDGLFGGAYSCVDVVTPEDAGLAGLALRHPEVLPRWTVTTRAS